MIDAPYRVIKCHHQTPDAHVYLVANGDVGDKPSWLKLWLRQCNDWKKQQARIEAELRVLTLLTSAYFIQPIRISKLADGSPYIVVEFAEGEVMLNAIKNTKYREAPVTTARAIDLALQLVHAVGCAFVDNRVLHCGLNPRSMYLRRSGHLLLFDLQYAKVDGVSAQQQLDSLPVDVMRYAAPELAEDPSCGDLSSEIYSICANLYFWLSGEPPIPGDSDIEVYRSLHSWTPVPLRRLRRSAEVSPTLDELVLRGLSKYRDERFQTLEELHSALTAVQWDLCSRRLEVSPPGDVKSPPPIDPRVRANYLDAARLLVENRRSSSLFEPMRVIERLERDAEPHLRRVVHIVDSFANRDVDSLSAEERAAIERVRRQ